MSKTSIDSLIVAFSSKDLLKLKGNNKSPTDTVSDAGNAKASAADSARLIVSSRGIAALYANDSATETLSDRGLDKA